MKLEEKDLLELEALFAEVCGKNKIIVYNPARFKLGFGAWSVRDRTFTSKKNYPSLEALIKGDVLEVKLEIPKELEK